MNWISWFGLGIVLLLLIPHAVYAAAGYRVGGVQLAETVLRQAKEGLR